MRAGFHLVLVACGTGCYRHDMSQSLVNEGRFPPMKDLKNLMRDFEIKSQSLVNEGRFPQNGKATSRKKRKEVVAIPR